MQRRIIPAPGVPVCASLAACGADRVGPAGPTAERVENTSGDVFVALGLEGVAGDSIPEPAWNGRPG